MQYQFPDFVIAYVISAALCFLSAGMVWRRRINPGSTQFALLMLSLTAWSIASIFETGTTNIAGKIFWSKWQYLGITTVSPLWLLFSSQYTGKDKLLNKTMRWLIWVIPATTMVLAVTNEYHHLIWTNVTIEKSTFYLGNYEHGIVFYVHMIYSYICLLVGTVWLLIDAFTTAKNRRFQSVIFVVCVIVAWLANALYIFQLFPIIGFDITPLAISLIALVLSWPISRYQLFDLVPIARDTLLDSMIEGVIVIDPNDHILEINPAAIEIIDYKGSNPIGRSIWEIFGEHTEIIEKYRGKTNLQAELEIPGDLPRTIDLQITSIDKEGENKTGQLIVFRDISKQKETERIEKDQREFAETLADTAAVINSSLDQNVVLEKILQNVAKVVPHEAANIALVDEEGIAYFIKAVNPEKYGKNDFLLSQSFDVSKVENFVKMAETHKALITADTRSYKEWGKVIKGCKWIKSCVAAPIFHQDELLGFINLDSSVPNFYKPIHAKRLEIFASYVATAITNAKHYSETKYYADEMAILYEISLAIAAGVGLEKTTQAVFRQLRSVISTDLFYLALYDLEKRIVSYYMYQGDGERVDIEPFFLAQRPSLTRYVIQKKETVYIQDFHADEAEVKVEDVIKVPGFDNRSYLGIPLILRGEVMGVLSVQSGEPSAYDPSQIRLVETIAHQATIAMDNAKLFEKMQEMAITDGLTGLYNRRYFFMILENEIERTKRYQSPLSLIMMDIDYFKKVNDEFGHLAGDHVLKSFSEICTKLLRHTDNMFRYGGEEFVILLPETTSEEALKVGERIRETVEEQLFKTMKGEVKITVSVGVSEFKEEFTTINEFIESVDKALYQAKHSGRNCIRLFSDK